MWQKRLTNNIVAYSFNFIIMFQGVVCDTFVCWIQLNQLQQIVIWLFTVSTKTIHVEKVDICCMAIVFDFIALYGCF